MAKAKPISSLGRWILPQPVIKTKQYINIPRLGKEIPFGYTEDPADKYNLIAVPEELEALEQAKVHLKTYSYRKVAAWLTTVTGRDISHVGLRKRVLNEQTYKKRVTTYRELAKRYYKCLQKAQKYEEQVKRLTGEEIDFDFNEVIDSEDS